LSQFLISLQQKNITSLNIQEESWEYWDNPIENFLFYAISCIDVDLRHFLFYFLLNHGMKIPRFDMTELDEADIVYTCYNSLHLAVIVEDIELVRYLLKYHNINLRGTVPSYLYPHKNRYNRRDDSYSGRTPLHYAVDSGNMEIVKLLVDNGAVVDLITMYGDFTPLHLAVEKNYVTIVKYLLEHGASPSLKHYSGNGSYGMGPAPNEDAIHICKKCGHTELIELLQSYIKS